MTVPIANAMAGHLFFFERTLSATQLRERAVAAPHPPVPEPRPPGAGATHVHHRKLKDQATGQVVTRHHELFWGASFDMEPCETATNTASAKGDGRLVKSPGADRWLPRAQGAVPRSCLAGSRVTKARDLRTFMACTPRPSPG